MIVVDASALLDLLLRRPGSADIDTALEGELLIHAPHLLDTEVLHALRRWCGQGRLPLARAEAALEVMGELALERYAHAPFSRRVWSLRDRLSAYDATYVALAESLDAQLVTSDARLARGAEGLVDVVGV